MKSFSKTALRVLLVSVMPLVASVPLVRLVRQALAVLVLSTMAGAASAAPVELAGNLPVSSALAGEQSDAAVLPLDRPSASFISVTALVTSVQWWGYDLAGVGGSNQFVVRINGTPLTGALSVLTSPPEVAVGVDVSRYTLDLTTAFNVSAGASSLTVVNDTDQVEWYWQAAASGANQTMSFRVLGERAVMPVSEPGALTLVAGALLALRLARLNAAA